MILTTADHKSLIHEGMSILHSVNDSISEDDPPFVLVEDAEVEELKSFWYKVRCKVDGELLLLCPPKKNLRANLESHLQGLVHTKCMEDLVAAGKSTSSSALNNGGRGRPPSRSRAMIGNQCDLHGWFRALSLPSATSSEGSETLKPDSIFGMLYWDYWKKTTSYGGKKYNVQGLLQDSKSSTNWVLKPTTSVEFMFDGCHNITNGCFHHAQCLRFYATRTPFPQFSCSSCIDIVEEMDFRLCVVKEGHALIKQGLRDMGSGRKIDYLSTSELACHSHTLAKKFREEKSMHWIMKLKVAQLKMTKKGLKLSAVENFNRKDVLAFCNNILAVHRTNALGGKPALWDFLRDVAANLNQVKQGHRSLLYDHMIAMLSKFMCLLYALLLL